MDLGDGVQAFHPTSQIQEAVYNVMKAEAITGKKHDVGVAAFSKYDLRANEVTVWFPPQLESVARKFGAAPCEKPTSSAGFSMIVGHAQSWDEHFPGYVPHRHE